MTDSLNIKVTTSHTSIVVTLVPGTTVVSCDLGQVGITTGIVAFCSQTLHTSYCKISCCSSTATDTVGVAVNIVDHDIIGCTNITAATGKLTLTETYFPSDTSDTLPFQL